MLRRRSRVIAHHNPLQGHIHVQMTWQVLRLGAWLPALQELHACENAISSLAAGSPRDADAASNPMLARLQACSPWTSECSLAPQTSDGCLHTQSAFLASL